MTHGSVAKKVRERKERHPEKYCRVKNCLWRVPAGEFLCERCALKLVAKMGLEFSDQTQEQIQERIAALEASNG